jgi:hypothetical protein
MNRGKAGKGSVPRGKPYKETKTLSGRSSSRPKAKRKAKERIIRLIIPRNLLRWYNELDDRLELLASDFPKEALEKIIQFGVYEIEEISKKRLSLIKPIPPKPPKLPKSEEGDENTVEQETSE